MSGGYFDAAAAAVCRPETLSSDELFANPSSLHAQGIKSEQAIAAASETLARLLCVKPNEIYYTSGATESNNLAVLGFAYARKPCHIITSEIEHPSVLLCFKHLEQNGFDVTYIKASADGRVTPDSLLSAIRPKTAFVSLFYIHNETGAINDIEGLVGAAKSVNERLVFHTDIAQGFGKIRLNLKGIDAASFSAHKIHGPKGIGGLYVRQNIKLQPLLYGGGQQKGLRPGTENIQGIMGLSRAAELSFKTMDEDFKYVSSLKQGIIKGIQNIGGMRINGGDNTSPYILNLSIKGVKGEVLLNALSLEGYYISTGAACHTKRGGQSAISKIAPQWADFSVRLSFSRYNTKEECEGLIEALTRNAERLRGRRD